MGVRYGHNHSSFLSGPGQTINFGYIFEGNVLLHRERSLVFFGIHYMWRIYVLVSLSEQLNPLVVICSVGSALHIIRPTLSDIKKWGTSSRKERPI